MSQFMSRVEEEVRDVELHFVYIVCSFNSTWADVTPSQSQSQTSLDGGAHYVCMSMLDGKHKHPASQPDCIHSRCNQFA